VASGEFVAISELLSYREGIGEKVDSERGLRFISLVLFVLVMVVRGYYGWQARRRGESS